MFCGLSEVLEEPMEGGVDLEDSGVVLGFVWWLARPSLNTFLYGSLSPKPCSPNPKLCCRTYIRRKEALPQRQRLASGFVGIRPMD